MSVWNVQSLSLRMSSPIKLTTETSVSLMTVWKSFVNSRPNSSSRDFHRANVSGGHSSSSLAVKSKLLSQDGNITFVCLHFNSVSFIYFPTVSHVTPWTQHLTTLDDQSSIPLLARCFRLTACPERQEVVQGQEDNIMFRLRVAKECIQRNSVPKILHDTSNLLVDSCTWSLYLYMTSTNTISRNPYYDLHFIIPVHFNFSHDPWQHESQSRVMTSLRRQASSLSSSPDSSKYYAVQDVIHHLCSRQSNRPKSGLSPSFLLPSLRIRTQTHWNDVCRSFTFHCFTLIIRCTRCLCFCAHILVFFADGYNCNSC